MIGALAFDFARPCVVINDRLTAPNEPQTLDALRPALEPFLTELYGADVTITHAAGDPRGRFRADITGGDADVATLLGRLSD